MSISFGIYARPSSALWSDVRKGPPLEAVHEHLDRVVIFGPIAKLLADRKYGRGIWARRWIEGNA